MTPVFLVLAIAGAVCQQPLAQQAAATQQVVTSFAVPVGVPVATVANPSLFYSYNAYAPQQAAASADVYSQSFEARLAERIAEKIAARMAGGTFEAKALTVVDQHCAKCHSGPEPKGGFAVDLGPLTAAQKLKSINRILADDTGKRMPKGEALTGQEIGKLIQFLSTPEVTAAAAKPGPIRAAVEQVPPPPAPVPNY